VDLLTSTETFRTDVMGCCWNNYTEAKKAEKKIIYLKK
jgi:hypothetical protein